MRRSLRSVGLVCLLGLFYGLQGFVAGYDVNGDTLRDLFRSLDIVDHGTFYALGAPAGGLRFSLTSIYYYFMAVPLFVSRSMDAILIWVVVWQVATVLVVWNTVHRLFDRRTATVVAVAFLLSDFVHQNYNRITFSNYCFITGALTVRSLYEFQIARRPIFLVGCFFFFALAVNFHFGAVALGAVLVIVIVVVRENASAWQLGLAAAAGLLPLLPALGSTDVLPNGPFAKGAFVDFLRLNSGVVPVAIAALFMARSGGILQRRRLWIAALLITAAIGTPLGLMATGFSPRGPIRFFNFAIDLAHAKEGGPAVSMGFLATKTLALVLAEMSTFGSDSLATLGRVLFWFCAVLGVRTIVETALAFRRGERDRTAAGGSLITLAWLGATFPLGILSCVGSFPASRYLCNAILPLLVVFALGLNEVHQRYSARIDAFIDSRARWVERHPQLARVLLLPGALFAGVLVSPVTWAVLGPSLNRVARQRVPAMWRVTAVTLGLTGLAMWILVLRDLVSSRPGLRATETLLAASRQRLGLGHDALLTRLHGAITEDWGFCDWRFGSCLLQLELDGDRSLGPARDPREHYRLVEASYAPAGAIDLAFRAGIGAPRLAAVPFIPALDIAHLRVLQGGESLDLPFRSISASSAEAKYIQPTARVQGTTGPMRIEIPRGVPMSPALDGVEADVGPRDRFEDCRIELTADGTPVAARPIHSEMLYRYSYRLPESSHPTRIDLAISGCNVEFLDVFDISFESH